MAEMSDLGEKNINPKFMSLVIMLASACWQQMGKVPNPMSGKIEKELGHAQMTLDLIMMLRDKTKGNLTPEEQKLIDNTISDLQLNYADEAAKTSTTEPKN